MKVVKALQNRDIRLFNVFEDGELLGVVTLTETDHDLVATATMLEPTMAAAFSYRGARYRGARPGYDVLTEALIWLGASPALAQFLADKADESEVGAAA